MRQSFLELFLQREVAVADADFFADEQTLTLNRRKKRFTLIEANRTLPLVRKIVTDLMSVHARARELHGRLEKRISREDRYTVEAELDSVVQRLEHYVDELAEVGCEIKDYQLGLVDYVCKHDGRDVYLCWRMGEETITHWHEIDAGFAARKPVTSLK